ncbi:MAG: DUF512 domain-containing protein, partial [Candidatus Riflebacteria bacterium]|nr:DUF512 domain-containing protein [Candidatus Riflebacteria bacterium]
MKRPQATIATVQPGSIADELGLAAGDVLLKIDGRPVEDLLDFQYLSASEHLTLLVCRAGEPTLFEIEKGSEDDLGLGFSQELFDGIRRCGNSCVFCFVHQNPRGLRRSLYVKDEDFRQSFLYGNYVTLTNLSRHDLDRIAAQRLSPLYVSVHATDPAVRNALLGRPSAPPLLPQLDFLAGHGVEFFAQVVLCPGLNDGPVFDRTLRDLERYPPNLRAIAVVPVGLTCHRERLPRLTPFDRALARRTVELCHARQAEYLGRFGTRLVFVADELYLTAGLPFPEARAYERFENVEDGVGMIPRFLRDLARALSRFRRVAPAGRRALIVTGRAA